LKTGGTSWFTDLTVADPLFLLPIMTCTSMIINIRMGGDGVDTMDPTMKKVLYAIPILSIPVMIQFPMALNVYWLANNLISITQVRILSTNHAKRVFGFPTLKKSITTDSLLQQMQTREAMRQRKLKEHKAKSKKVQDSQDSKT